jgi:hypothetical protein
MNKNFLSLGLGSFVAASALLISSVAPVMAQAAPLIGQCRAVNKQTPLFKTRSTSGEAAVLLKMNDQVVLSENSASDGLIAVSKPSSGFVAVANLKTCPGAKPPVTPPVKPPTKPDDASACRLVVQSKGLAIRKDPATTGEVVGGAGFNEKVTLVMPMEKKVIEGRTWLKIEKPNMGWVSEGFEAQPFKNLASCK